MPGMPKTPRTEITLSMSFPQQTEAYEGEALLVHG